MDRPEHHITRWRNIGFWAQVWLYPELGLRTPWGNIIFKRVQDRLFSERCGYTRCLTLGRLSITWVRLRSIRQGAKP